MSAANATGLVLPNPDTPLAFLPPSIAYQDSVSLYVYVGSLAVMIWDILDNVSDDYKLLFKSKIGLSTLIYFVSRIGSLAYAIFGAIFGTAPTGHCVHFEHIGLAFYPISIGSTGLLFFFRLRAIYNRNHIVVALFFVLWLALVGATLLLPILAIGGNIGNTEYCVDANIPRAVFASIFAPLIHDTLVFGAISYKLAWSPHSETVEDRLKVAIYGKFLPTFTRALLLDGQRYYLLSLITNIVVVVMVYDNNVPIPLRGMGAVTNLVITNIMACRVYRRIKFGHFRETTVVTSKEIKTKEGSFPVFGHFHANRQPQTWSADSEIQLHDTPKTLGGSDSSLGKEVIIGGNFTSSEDTH